ncbi:MAG TPA: hypothetical protein VLH10_03045 [Yinghuangia sp.]|uniref:hypothetical protein n=1 Tax=Yinghuangia sp. YIM S10712 TaxID=3436930 RepID=UPI002C7EF710|nr:hypothetical protein [Yinghuangia sp.]
MAKQKAKPHMNKSPMFSDAAQTGDEARAQNRSAQDRASSQDRSPAANSAHESGTIVAEHDDAQAARAKSSRKQPQRAAETGPRARRR